MFTHIFKYRLTRLLRDRENFFWSLMFPIVLGTLFFFTFGNYMQRKEVFIQIPVGYVSSGSYDYAEPFEEFLHQLEYQDNEGYLILHEMSADDAEKALEAGEVKGVIYADNTLRLAVAVDGIEQSILKTLLDSYLQTEGAIRQVIERNPEKLPAILEALANQHSYNQETLLGDENQDSMLHYFYALLAMACLYGCFNGLTNANDIQANISQLGARRGAAPVHKLKITLAEFLAAVTLQMLSICILLFYLIVILGISFGSQIPQILLVCLVGCMIGVAYGTFIGAIFKTGEGIKVAIILGTVLTMCFLGGLMFSTLQYLIEKSFPLLNRMNPAALLADSFYALNIYDNYTRFFSNLGILVIMAAGLLLINFLIMRRTKYANI